MLYRLATLMELHAKARRYAKVLEDHEWRFPFTTSMLTAMEEQAFTAATYPICRTDAKIFPNKPHECEHPRKDLYKHGNDKGRFRECRACGARWVVEEGILNPITGQEVEILQELAPRPAPGKAPKAKPKGKATPKRRAAQEAEASSTAHSGYFSSSAHRSPAATTPRPTSSRTRPTAGPPIPLNSGSEAEESWEEEMFTEGEDLS